MALIIAPGAALPGQARPSNAAVDYLDAKDGNSSTSNSDGDSTYFSGPLSEKFNDKLLALTTTSLFSQVNKRILGEIRYAYLASGTAPPQADTDGDGLSNPGSTTGRFPYKNPAFTTIESPSWVSSGSSHHLWYESLASNNWFSVVGYDSVTKTLSLGEQSITLP